MDEMLTGACNLLKIFFFLRVFLLLAPFFFAEFLVDCLL